MEVVRLIIATIGRFVKLPDGQKVLFLFAIIVCTLVFLLIRSNKKLNNHEYTEALQNNERIQIVKQLEMDKDSLYIVIQQMTVEHLNQKIKDQDSLIRESNKIKNEIKPLVKKLNKKINEVNHN